MLPNPHNSSTKMLKIKDKIARGLNPVLNVNGVLGLNFSSYESDVGSISAASPALETLKRNFQDFLIDHNEKEIKASIKAIISTSQDHYGKLIAVLNDVDPLTINDDYRKIIRAALVEGLASKKDQLLSHPTQQTIESEITDLNKLTSTLKILQGAGGFMAGLFNTKKTAVTQINNMIKEYQTALAEQHANKP